MTNLEENRAKALRLEDALSMSYSSIVKKIIVIAKEAYNGAIRKNTDEWYLLHAFRVGLILWQLKANEYVISAGLLHGVLEHTKWKKDDLARRLDEVFAHNTVKQIIAHIAAVTEYFEGNVSWRERKEKFLQHQRTKPTDVLLIVFADKLDILASLAADFEKRGDKIWGTLSTSDTSTRGDYYTNLYHLFTVRLVEKNGILKFFKQYETYLKVLFPSVPDHNQTNITPI
ncbi:MAG: HD domain-containing protein [Parcubacteria group bacterium]|nr:HD domain-containing protein [Parcubacteria group bacterium]